MKKLSLLMCVFCLFFSLGLTACAGEKKYALSVYGEELLYEELQDEYPAGQEVRVKVKITPHTTTVAYLDLIPLTRVKSTQDDFYTFTFTMPDRSADLRVETKRGFEEDLLTGVYLTFRDKNSNPIENLNQDFDSPEAIAWYYYSYTDEENGSVRCNKACIRVVILLSPTPYRQIVSPFRLRRPLCCSYFNARQIIYVFENNLNVRVERRFIFIPRDVVSFFVMEYDKDGQLIKTSEFTGKNRSETFTVGESCEYAVIEEEYTVMIGEQKDEKHYERTLIEKTAVKNGKTLKYARGDGLISPVRLEIIW